MGRRHLTICFGSIAQLIELSERKAKTVLAGFEFFFYEGKGAQTHEEQVGYLSTELVASRIVRKTSTATDYNGPPRRQ